MRFWHHGLPQGHEAAAICELPPAWPGAPVRFAIAGRARLQRGTGARGPLANDTDRAPPCRTPSGGQMREIRIRHFWPKVVPCRVSPGIEPLAWGRARVGHGKNARVMPQPITARIILCTKIHTVAANPCRESAAQKRMWFKARVCNYRKPALEASSCEMLVCLHFLRPRHVVPRIFPYGIIYSPVRA